MGSSGFSTWARGLVAAWRRRSPAATSTTRAPSRRAPSRVCPCRDQAGSAFGRLALRRLLSAPDRASGCPKRLRAARCPHCARRGQNTHHVAPTLRATCVARATYTSRGGRSPPLHVTSSPTRTPR
eukprot:scaffold75294_cov54-Phaeocystis_antarctica.AAC.1